MILKGLGFKEEGKQTLLYIVTNSSIYLYNTLVKDYKVLFIYSYRLYIYIYIYYSYSHYFIHVKIYSFLIIFILIIL